MTVQASSCPLLLDYQRQLNCLGFRTASQPHPASTGPLWSDWLALPSACSNTAGVTDYLVLGMSSCIEVTHDMSAMPCQ